MNRPTEIHRPWLWTVLLSAMATAVVVSELSPALFPVKSDELVVAWMGKQAAAGRAPYADFFCVVPPLTVYGLAAVFKAFGASLAIFRAVTLVWLLGITLVLERLFLLAKMPRPWAAASAFLFPGLFLTFWPVPSHHWFALGFGLSSLWASLVAGERRSPFLWFASGTLTACAGLCLQTEGVLFAALLVLSMALLGTKPFDRVSVFAALLGLMVPLGAFAGIVTYQGSMGRAFYCLVTWPATYYKQPGGFNDLDILTSIAQEFSSRSPSRMADLPVFASFLVTLGAACWAPVSLAFSPKWTSPADGDGAWRRWLFSLLAWSATTAVFLGGRAEWVHLTMFVTVMVASAFFEISWTTERVRPVVFKILVSVGLAVSASLWIGVWSRRPPLLSDIAGVDALVAKNSVPSILRELPSVNGRPPAVVFLPHGADLYFFWAPEPPPVDWVDPPSFKYNAPWEFEALASFLERRPIPYVLIQGDFAAMFLGEPSPIQRVLRERYRPLRKTPLGLVLERVPHAAPTS